MDLVVVSGYTGSGKSTIASAVAESIGATVASFDWLMSALRSVPEVWAVAQLPVERQRAVGWLRPVSCGPLSAGDMAMTLRLTDDEHEALRAIAEAEGISMREAARKAVREFVARGRHRDRVGAAARLVMGRHADALRRLGE